MNGSGTAPVNGESRVSLALLRWQWRRNMRLNLFALVMSVGICGLLLANRLQELPWPPGFVALGVVAAGISGLTAAGETSGAFLLARPASRRQVFNALVAGNLLPWFLLAVVPAAGAMAWGAGKGSPPDRFLDAPAVFYAVYLLWTLTIYLAGVYQGCYLKAVYPRGFTLDPENKAAVRPLPSLALVLLLAMGLSLAGDGFWAGRRVMAFLSSYGPAVAVTVAFLAASAYQAGWRLFRSLDY